MTARRARAKWVDVPAPPARDYKPECWLEGEYDAPAWPFFALIAALVLAATYL